MKTIITFVNSSNPDEFNRHDALKEIKELFEKMDDDHRTYLVTIEEVKEIY